MTISRSPRWRLQMSNQRDSVYNNTEQSKAGAYILTLEKLEAESLELLSKNNFIIKIVDS